MTLYVNCPDELRLPVRTRLEAIFPEQSVSDFSSDEQTIFAIDVPYPVGQTRYDLAALYQGFSGRWVTWSWTPLPHDVVFPGGTLSMKCQLSSADRLSQEVDRLFPGVFVYVYHTSDGWAIYDVDIPAPDQHLYDQLFLLSMVFGGYMSWSWRPWFEAANYEDCAHF
jgi:hypothetical protein